MLTHRSNRSPLSAALPSCGRNARGHWFRISLQTRYDRIYEPYAVEAGREALELADTLGLDEIRAHTLVSIGTARFAAGDSRGREDLEEGLAVARAGNRLEVQVRATTNLGFMASRDGNLREALRLTLEAERLGERIGNADEMRFDRGNIVPLRLDVGDWDESLRIADELIAESERLGAHYQDPAVFGARAWIRAARGDLDAALEDEAEALVRARRAKDPQVLFPALGLSAWIRAEAGRLPEAKSLARELVSHGLDAVEIAIDHFMWVAGAVGRGGEVLALLEAADDRPWFAVARAVLSADYERAAEMFDAMGSARCAALARLRAAEALVGQRQRAETDKELQLALAFWRSVGATRYVRQGEALLAATA
jgi:hypothetical protein